MSEVINSYYTIPRLINDFKEYDHAHGTLFEMEFKKMIVLDSIVFNHDRHLNNSGLLFDNESFDIIGFAPLFDFNFSFLCSLTMEDLKNYRESLITYDLRHKLVGDFELVGREIMTEDIADVLPVDLDIPKHHKYNMESERIRLLEDIFYENYENMRKGRG